MNKQKYNQYSFEMNQMFVNFDINKKICNYRILMRL